MSTDLILAILHHLGVFTVAGVIAAELVLIRPGMSMDKILQAAKIDALYGIAAGSVFVFVLSIGNFVTPNLLGGGRSLMVGNLIFDQFLSARDWPFGAALAFVLIGLMMLLLVVQAWAANRAQGSDANA